MEWIKRGSATSMAEIFMRNMGVDSLSRVNDWCIKSKNNGYRIDRLKDAVEFAKKFKNGRVTIVGDYDADGCTSTSILYMGLKEYGFTNVSFRIPKRFSEGFGINETIIDEIDHGLIITCDNGIAGIDAIKKAKKKGLSVIVTDHHDAVIDPASGNPVYPPADIIIDPSAIPGSADFDGYCGAGIAYRFICELFDNRRDIKAKYAGLAAIGTVGDVMELHEENYVIVRNGIKALSNPNFCTSGLYALLNESNCISGLTAKDLAFVIAPTLNALSRLKDDGSIDQVQLLTFNGTAIEAKEMAQKAIYTNQKRKEFEKETFTKAIALIKARKYSSLCPLTLFIPDAREGIIGITAGSLAEKYTRPVLVFTNIVKNGVTYYKGSARAYGEYNVKEAFDRHGNLFVHYGGHAGAAGMTILPENLKKIADCLQKDATSYKPPATGAIYYDLEIKSSDIGRAIEELKKYEPFGEGNPAPVFKVTGFKPVSKNGEYRKVFKSGGIKLNGFGLCAVNFKGFKGLEDIPLDAKMEFIGTISDNTFKGETTHQVEFLDCRRESLNC